MAVNGLSLGLGANDVKNIVGEPTFRNFSFFAYRYEDQTNLESGKIFDVYSAWIRIISAIGRREASW